MHASTSDTQLSLHDWIFLPQWFSIWTDYFLPVTKNSFAKPKPFERMGISCRLYLLQNAWCARTNDQNQWLQVKFAQRVEIRRVATQGRHRYTNQWVQSYALNHSSNGLLFYQYRTTRNQTVSSFADVLLIPMFLQCRLIWASRTLAGSRIYSFQ